VQVQLGFGKLTDECVRTVYCNSHDFKL
jgi:hypothetical protein